MTSRRAAPILPDPPGDQEARFRDLVQSPLRAGLLRFLSARPGEGFDIDSLMSTFGRMRLDARPGDRLSLSISAGVAVSPHDGDTYEALLTSADGRMYGDKRARKTAVERQAGAADVSAKPA